MITPIRCVCDLDNPGGSKVVRWGKFYRQSTDSMVQRYHCLTCKKHFSEAIFEMGYRQKKRYLNDPVRILLSHLVSQREAARILKTNFKTVVRKFLYMSLYARQEFHARNYARRKASAIEFDDLETFEHTKNKPISTTIAVEKKTRWILAVESAHMPARGRLAHKAREKYGKRPDMRREARKKVFERLTHLVEEGAEIRSDCHRSYPFLVRKYFPKAFHRQFLGKRATPYGQGELKEGKHDPLFSINHTCAMFRANVNRLIRKTWCTTKNMDRLQAHLILYANEHNRRIEQAEEKKLQSAS